ncbi:MAG: hypothetical protein M1378_14120 [Bacteroidetes bacterium]|nr:hypothetical protein [Bacteroidota bacterium]
MSKGDPLPHSAFSRSSWGVVTALYRPFSDFASPRIMRPVCLLLVLMALFSCSSTSFAQYSPRTDSTLATIKNLFDEGSYTTAELHARRALEDMKVSDSARVQLQKYLAFTLVAQGRNEAAIEHFVDALRLDSTLTLDPVLTSPKILSVFETARERYRERVTVAKLQRKVAVLSGGPTFRAMIFPGWDQLYRGRRTKGWILIGAGAAAAVTAITSDILRRDARTKYLDAATPALAESRYNTYNMYYKTEIYSVSAFVLIYLYSEFDSFLNLPPHFSAGYSPSTRSVEMSYRIGF